MKAHKHNINSFSNHDYKSNKFLKSILTSASMLTLLAISNTSYATDIIRKVKDDAIFVDINTGDGFVNSSPLNNNEVIQIQNNHAHSTHIAFDKPNIVVGGLVNQSGSDFDHSISITESVELGSVPFLNDSNPINFSFFGAKELILNGNSYQFDGTTVSANDYQSLGKLDFNDTNSALTINARDQKEINLTHVQIVGTDFPALGASSINIQTPLTTNYNNFSKIANHNISSKYQLEMQSNISPTLSNEYGKIQFNTQDSELVFHTTGGQNELFIAAKPMTPLEDGYGSIIINSDLDNAIFTIGLINSSIGTSQSNRIGKLSINNVDKFALRNKAVYVRDIELNGKTGGTAFFDNLVMGFGGKVLYKKDNHLQFSDTFQINDIDFNNTSSSLEVNKFSILTGEVLNGSKSKIHLDKNGHLQFENDINRVIDAQITTNNSTTEGAGTIEIRDLTQGSMIAFNNAIGSPETVQNNILHELQIAANGRVELNKASGIHKIEFTDNSDGVLRLSDNSNHYRIENITTSKDGNGTLEINKRIELITDIKIGADGTRLKAIDFTGDNILVLHNNADIYIKNLQNSSGADEKGTISVQGSTKISGGESFNNSIKEIGIGLNGKLAITGKYAVKQIAIGGTEPLELLDGFELQGNIFGITISGRNIDKDINIKGNVKINGDIGVGGIGVFSPKIRTVSLEGGGTSSFGGNMDVTNFNIINGTNVVQGRIITDNLNFDNANVTFSDNVSMTNFNINNGINSFTHDGTFFTTTNLNIKNSTITLNSNPDPANFNVTDGNNIINGDFSTFRLNINNNAKTRFNGNVTLKSNDFNINGEAEFNGRLTANQLQLLNENSTIKFLQDGTIFDTEVITDGTKGKAVFTGSTTINKPLGSLENHLKQIDFVANGGGNTVRKNMNINVANLYADNSNFHTVNVIPNQNTTLTGVNTNITDTTFTLGTNSFTHKLTGTATVTGTININTSVNNNDIGSLIFNAGNNINFANVNQVNINLDNASGNTSTASALNILTATGDNSLLGFDSLNGKVNLTRTNNGNLSGWTLNVGGGTIFLTPPSATVTTESTTPAAPVATTDIAESDIGTETIISTGGNASKLSDEDIASNTAQTTNSGNAGTHASSVHNTAHNSLTSHTHGLMSFSGFGFHGFGDAGDGVDFAYNDTSHGVSAGSDDALKNGIWFTPFYNEGTQKRRGTTQGHETEGYGGTIGFDRQVSDNSVAGISFTYTDTEMTHKGQKTSDKTNIETYIGALYGVHQFDQYWFMHGTLSYTINHIKSKVIRRVIGGTSVASSEHNSYLYSGELTGGYHYLLNQNLMMTPNVGIAYTYHDSKAHEETGTSENHKIAGHDTQKIDLIAGLRMRARMYESMRGAISPHLHAIVRYDLRDDKHIFDVTPIGDSGGASVTNNVKGNRAIVNLGAGVDFKYSNTTFTVSYDTHISTKYRSHHGSLKVKADF